MGVPEYCPPTRRQAITNIVDSVAQEQAALSNILAAEGDKMQKLICSPCVCPEMLLAANRSVEKTINAVARLETALQTKLELFEDCLCPREPGCGCCAETANEYSADCAD